jgi:uncharacterized membrane protein YdjX (TVP38/TMEM64 family)
MDFDLQGSASTQRATRTSKVRESPTAGDWIRLAAPIVVVAAFLLVAWRTGYFDLKDPAKLTAAADRVQDTPWLGPIFCAVYAVTAALAAPVSPLAYGAGAVFGVARGTLFVLLASIVGGAAGYVLARTIWADSARRILGRYQEKVQSLETGSAFLTTLRFQLLPIVPFGIFNYAAGASRIPFVPYILGTALGVLPGSVAAVYVGDRILAGIRSDHRALVVAAAVMIALMALSFVPTLIKKLRRS